MQSVQKGVQNSNIKIKQAEIYHGYLWTFLLSNNYEITKHVNEYKAIIFQTLTDI